MTQERQQQQLVERHKRFWDHMLDEPLIGRITTRNWKPRAYPIRGGNAVDPTPIQPDDMDVERFVGTGYPLPSRGHNM